MLKKTMTYEDYNGIERTEDFYFNFTKAEAMEMELSIDGGLTTYLDQIIKAKNFPELVKLFKRLILKAYGVKSPDGKRFIKNQELCDEFEQTEAFSQLYVELATDADAATAFVNGIAPKGSPTITKEQAEAKLLNKNEN